MKHVLAAAVSAFALLSSGAALAQSPELRPDQVAFRDLYKELIETDTSVSTGSCTLAAEKMAARLKAVGYTDDQLTVFKLCLLYTSRCV